MNSNESKINELTNKIYTEGVEKANKEAADILAKAKAEADALVKNAKDEADKIVAKANADVTALQNKINSELKTAGSQAVSTLKQEITSIVTEKALADGVKSSAKDADFVKSLIKDMISKWNGDGIKVSLPKESESAYKALVSEVMKNGVEISFDSRMDNGFKIGPKDNSYVLSFTDKDFLSFFKSFLKPKTKEILFDGE